MRRIRTQLIPRLKTKRSIPSRYLNTSARRLSNPRISKYVFVHSAIKLSQKHTGKRAFFRSRPDNNCYDNTRTKRNSERRTFILLRFRLGKLCVLESFTDFRRTLEKPRALGLIPKFFILDANFFVFLFFTCRALIPRSRSASIWTRRDNCSSRECHCRNMNGGERREIDGAKR